MKAPIRPWTSNSPGDLGLDSEMRLESAGRHAGRVEGDLDAGVDRNAGRLVVGNAADHVERPRRGDRPRVRHTAVGAMQREPVGLAGPEQRRRVQQQGVAGRFASLDLDRRVRADTRGEVADWFAVEARQAEGGVERDTGVAGLRGLERGDRFEWREVDRRPVTLGDGFGRLGVRVRAAGRGRSGRRQAGRGLGRGDRGAAARAREEGGHGEEQHRAGRRPTRRS